MDSRCDETTDAAINTPCDSTETSEKSPGWFFAVFSGMEMPCSSIAANRRPAIPKGLNRSAQCWPIPRGLPWVAAFKLYNPEGVEYQRLTKRLQPLQGWDFSLFSPKVARSSQPWPESFNPVGIAKPMARLKTVLIIPPKTAENPAVNSKPLPLNGLRGIPSRAPLQKFLSNSS
jgi:hypothetical protein